MRFILNLFRRYSEYPTQLGVSDFCRYDEEGNECPSLNFPYVLALKPLLPLEYFNGGGNNFIEDLLRLPEGTDVYDLYCISTPNDITKIEKVGRLRTESEGVRDGGGLFFKHQKREEDFEIKEEWKEVLKKRQGDVVGASYFDRIFDDNNNI